MPVKPATPVAAATLALLRDGLDGCEVLLIRRHLASRFAAGDFVFPGGKVEPTDAPDDLERRHTGLSADEATRRLGLDGASTAALSYWIAAIREAFEEVGVLVARDRHGRPARLSPDRAAAYRSACQRDRHAFWNMIRAEDLTIATDGLRYFAHWITPEEAPLRFDTRFFVAAMPVDQEAVADAHEIVAVRWLRPAEALEARTRGEISLRLPTMKALALFEGARSVDEALTRSSGGPVPTIRPRLVTENGRPRAILPGEPGYY